MTDPTRRENGRWAYGQLGESSQSGSYESWRKAVQQAGTVLDHAPRCQRRGAPLLRLSWRSLPELFCPECGRTAPAPDTRPTRPTHTEETNP